MMFGIFKEYIEKRINLIKINAIEQSAKISGLIFFFAIVLVVSMFFLAFFILSIGMLVGSLLGSYVYGFLLMSLVCILALVLLFRYRKSIQEYAVNVFIKSLND